MDSETFEIVEWDTSPKQPKKKKKERKTCVIVEEKEEKEVKTESWWSKMVDRMKENNQVIDGLVHQNMLTETAQTTRYKQLHQRLDSIEKAIQKSVSEKCDHCDALHSLKENSSPIKDHSSEIHHILSTLEQLNDKIGSYDVRDSLDALQKQVTSVHKKLNSKTKPVIPTVDIPDITCSDTSTLSPTNGIRKILKPELYKKYLKYKAKYFKLKYGDK